MNNFGSTLREWRESLGLSQEALSRLLYRRGYPVSIASIHRWEVGHASPHRVYVRALEACGFPLPKEERTP